MLLWMDPKQKAYGLQADSSYVENDDKPQYQWNPEVQVEVEQSTTSKKMARLWKGNGGSAGT